MADVKGATTAVGCNDTCSCPTPCYGDHTCRCKTSGGDMQHKKCSCGEHCGCNPCTCSSKPEVQGTGKAFCKCGSGCTCQTCAT